MLLQSLGFFKGFLFKDCVIIDDAVFKLHYGITSYLLLFCSVLVTGKVYLGDPIHCSLNVFEFFKVIQQDMLDSYCYIYSSFIIPTANDDGHPYPGVGPHTPEELEEEALVQSYYQWVPLILLLQVRST